MNQPLLGQIRGVMRLELKKQLQSSRALLVYMLALVPIIIVASFIIGTSILGVPTDLQGPNGAKTFYSIFFYSVMRFVIFLASAWIFMNLFRGEVLDRSLHYYFLTPIRRELLAVGKYVSGWIASVLLFSGAAAACLIAIYMYLGNAGAEGVFRGESMAHLLSYVSVTALALLGYGAVFLVVGLFFRNTIVPTLAILVWEGGNPYFPALLKRISVGFYVEPLLPVPPPEGTFEILADPVPAWLAVPGLILFTTLTLLVAAIRIRRMEISYASD
jgi:ABC-type transport system involved in multi-copper enzyme maturation permease subunit